ncbi:MAG: Crp/Fnr family transcriptional regulator [Prevotella sp.]|nr:Crp/Fnr family transcriptional regulator [Prevotella sp.]
MEQKYNTSALVPEIERLREFCVREGEAVEFNKGEQLEREGEPARWLAFVERGCFKYVTRGRNDGREHITWFSFEGEFVVDYPTFLYGRRSQTTIEAMMPTRVLRVSGERVEKFFAQNTETLKLRAVIAEHILFQFRSRYLDLHCSTPRQRYDQLLLRCPGIVNELPLKAIASFLNITPKTLSMLRRDITRGK